jgi:hypothetical protein
MSGIHIKRHLAPAFMWLAILALLVGCESSGTGQGTSLSDYSLRGAAVIDPNLDSTRVTAVGSRNDTLLSSAVIVLGGDTLVYDDTLFAVDSSWRFADDTARHYSPGTYVIEFDDNSFSRSFPQAIPDTFGITSLTPANRRIVGNESAQIEWTAKAGYTAFVVAVIKKDSAFVGKGWSIYAQNFANAANVPPDAFLGSNGIDPDTGLYNFYVYGIVGAPDSALSSALLPVSLPSQLADNISQQRLGGRFGVVVISLLDTIRVGP